MTWALERAPNPRVIRVHTTVELTRATIEKCPPASGFLLLWFAIPLFDLEREPLMALPMRLSGLMENND